jgi:hypothetical protein
VWVQVRTTSRLIINFAYLDPRNKHASLAGHYDFSWIHEYETCVPAFDSDGFISRDKMIHDSCER